ncbi:MAG: methylenetetrahydrofolate reductase [NAD(P)H] [Propionibacteriaceae bacterium]|nr:methylenetetrahydrofolate reductase [NAD(P)H] [Propionibacteriaceae bacterium]
MKISQLLTQTAQPVFSFEFFPPKDDAGQESLWQTLAKLVPLHPDFVSVTYGANGSQRERTVALTKRLSAETGMRTIAHLTCVGQSVAEVTRVIDEYAANGLRDILAIRGDMPGGPTVAWEPHPSGLHNATQLVELIRSKGDFNVGVAAFPDPHPAQRDPDLDARILKDKWQAGADFAVTQLFFSADSYFNLVDRVRSIGCDIPILPGIMPITLISQVMKFAEMSGAAVPATIRTRLETVANDPAAVRTTGTQICAELSQELLDRGAPGLHFFTQNRSTATQSIWQSVRPTPHPG